MADAWGVGHRLAARGRFPIATLAAVMVLAGCNDDGGNGYDGAASTTSSDTAGVDVEGTTADLRELLGTTPRRSPRA